MRCPKLCGFSSGLLNHTPLLPTHEIVTSSITININVAGESNASNFCSVALDAGLLFHCERLVHKPVGTSCNVPQLKLQSTAELPIMRAVPGRQGKQSSCQSTIESVGWTRGRITTTELMRVVCATLQLQPLEGQPDASVLYKGSVDKGLQWDRSFIARSALPA